jgi:hypothetical protein
MENAEADMGNKFIFRHNFSFFERILQEKVKKIKITAQKLCLIYSIGILKKNAEFYADFTNIDNIAKSSPNKGYT